MVKLLGRNYSTGSLKLYYAAPKNILMTLRNEDLPGGSKEIHVPTVYGFFLVKEKKFALKFYFQGLNELDFIFEDDDIEDLSKKILYAKLKKIQPRGCVVSGLFRKDEHSWLFIGKFNNLIIPDNFDFYEDDISYDNF